MAQPYLLSLENVTIRFGGLTALSDIDFQIGPDELVGLIGPNGAGKTTIFNLVTGVYQPSAGTISFRGGSIAGSSPHRLAWHGIARTFQKHQAFRLTVGF
jgi:branched-chain amino acid transport system ATP-binding protein